MTWWTAEQTEYAKDLWQRGYSAGMIAMEMPGFTRSAIAGRLKRIGVMGVGDHATVVKKPMGAKSTGKVLAFNARPLLRKAPLSRPRRKAISVEPDLPPVEYLEADSWHCHALLEQRGSDGLRMRCGNRRLKDCSYCERHEVEYKIERQWRG